MSSLNTTVLLQVLADLQKSDGGAVLQPRAIVTFRDHLLNGSAEDQANRPYGPARRTLAGGAVEELDLAGGSLKDQLGDAVTFTRVNLLYIANTKLSTDVGANLEIGGVVGTVENWKLFKSADDIFVLGPGGVFFFFDPSNAGRPVTAGTEDLLRVANVSSPSVSINYDILIVGAGT